MSWVTPKTNWVAGDEVTIVDWNRIRDNVIYLKYLLDTYYSTLPITEVETKTHTGYPKPSELNAIVQNIRDLNNQSVNLPLGSIVTYESNGRVPTAQELNEIEEEIAKIKETFESMIAEMPKLAFRLGNYREIRV